ncbi:MAG: DUF4391 domain-containing protein [Mariprofundaceae bacterium]|nr:DUF4391 domain-containing protein [Mariprofundaceae bacterium]
MSAALFAWPGQAAFHRVLPKNKIYTYAKPSAAVKELFVRQVEQIVWQYKLAPETIHLPATKSVPEIQIFSLALKTESLSREVLRCIDRAVQFPIIFELKFDGKTQLAACYKRPNEADRSKWVCSEYFSTDWFNNDSERVPLPTALDLGGLYEQLLKVVMPIAVRKREPLADLVARVEQIHLKQREADQLATRLGKEKQFNRKVELNSKLRQLKNELASLTTENTERHGNG